MFAFTNFTMAKGLVFRNILNDSEHNL